jgi:hypothetical protein
MSIIYEALKKVEKSQTEASPILAPAKPKSPAQTNKIKLKYAAIYLFALVVGIFIANIIFGIINSKPVITSQQKIQPPPTPAPASAFIPAPKPAAAIKSPEPIAAKKAEPQAEELVLNGLFFSEDKGYALINNRILKEGDEINGATVKRITLEGAELEFKGATIKLSNSK